MIYDRFKFGRVKDGAPDGYIKFSNGEMGFVSQLCAKDPKLLDVVGSDLVNDWTRYCSLPPKDDFVPDPTPGCRVRLVTYDVVVDYTYRALFDPNAPSEPGVTQFEVAHWEGAREFSASIEPHPVYGDLCVAVRRVDGGCDLIEADSFDSIIVNQPFNQELILSIEGLGVAFNGPSLNIDGDEVILDCCPFIPAFEERDYIRRGTYTRREFLENVLPEVIQMFLPNPFSVGRRLGRGFGWADDIIGFAPTRPPTSPVKPRPGKPLPTRELPSRRPKPRPVGPPRPARSPRPARPIGPRRRPAPTPRPAPGRKPSRPPLIRPAPTRPRTPVPPPPPAPAPRPIKTPTRTPSRPYPNVRPPSLPRKKPVPSPSPSRRPVRPPAPGPSPRPIPGPSPSRRPIPGPSPSRRPAPSPSPSRRPSPAPKPIPGPSPSRRPAPGPSPRPSPSPSPGIPRNPVPSPQRPGVPRPRPTPQPSRRRTPSPATEPRPVPSPVPSQPIGPRPVPSPTSPRPVPVPLPGRPVQPQPLNPSRTPFPTPQPTVRPQPFPRPAETVFRPPEVVSPVPVPPELVTIEGVPQVPIDQNLCPPCPTVVINRNVPVMIPGPPGPPGEKGDKGEDGEGGDMAILISEDGGAGQYAQTLDFTRSVVGQTSGTLPRNISRVVLRYGDISASTPIYGADEVGNKMGGFGTVALVLNDVIVSQYSLNRFQDLQICIPYGVNQTVEVFVSPTAACKVAVLDEGDRWRWVKLSDPDNLPEVTVNQIN